MSDPGTTPADRLILKGIAVLVVGLALVSHGCARFVGGGGHVFGAEIAQGTVVEVNKRQVDFRGRGMSEARDVYVEYPIGDRRVRVRDALGATGDDPAKGDRVKVYFDPQAPERAMVGGTAQFSGVQYVIEWLAGIAALVLSGTMILGAARAKRKETRVNAKEA